MSTSRSMISSRISVFIRPCSAPGRRVVKDDYAKWDLADPAVNFAISARARNAGLDHVGIQADSCAGT